MNRKSTYNHSVKPGRWINRFFDVSTSHYISLKSLWTCHCLWMNNESCIRHDAIIRWNVIRRIATFRRNVIWRIGMRLNVIRCFDETSFDELTRHDWAASFRSEIFDATIIKWKWKATNTFSFPFHLSEGLNRILTDTNTHKEMDKTIKISIKVGVSSTTSGACFIHL